MHFLFMYLLYHIKMHVFKEMYDVIFHYMTLFLRNIYNTHLLLLEEPLLLILRLGKGQC